MKKSEKIINKITNDEMQKVVVDFDKWLKRKGTYRSGFHNTLAIAEYCLLLNNKYRKSDKAVIKYVKVR